MMLRATLARRFPLAARGSNCVARTRTRASSAATKNAFSRTSAMTARIFRPSSGSSFQFMSEAHFAKNEFQNVLQGDDSDLAPVPAEHHRQTLSAALHAAQRHFEPQVFVEVERRSDIVRRRL